MSLGSSYGDGTANAMVAMRLLFWQHLSPPQCVANSSPRSFFHLLIHRSLVYLPPQLFI